MPSLSPEWFFGLGLLQGLVFLVDEFYFHHKRGLPRWERIGHPIDSVFFLLPLFYLYFQGAPDWIYWVMAAFSCVLISKDEWIHAKVAAPAEIWLHSFLFMLHPLVLVLAGMSPVTTDIRYVLMLGILSTLTIYQIVYWNWIAKPTPESAS